MRVIVTGASGFVGRYLVHELASHGHEVIAVDRQFPEFRSGFTRRYGADLLNTSALTSIITQEKPDACVHLAAISSVPACKDNPLQTMAVNVTGTQNLLEIFRTSNPATRFLYISTGHVYGVEAKNETVTEDAGLAPDSLYAVSKASADQLALAYARTYAMPVIVARPNNHIGPNQSTQFVVSTLAAQIKALSKSPLPHTLEVGNVDSVRDFTDVRDVVRAYRLLLETGKPGLAYNISSAREVSIGAIIRTLCDLVGVQPNLVVSPARFRPTDHSPRLDTTRIHEHTGWATTLSLEATLRDILSATGAV